MRFSLKALVGAMLVMGLATVAVQRLAFRPPACKGLALSSEMHAVRASENGSITCRVCGLKVAWVNLPFCGTVDTR